MPTPRPTRQSRRCGRRRGRRRGRCRSCRRWRGGRPQPSRWMARTRSLGRAAARRRGDRVAAAGREQRADGKAGAPSAAGAPEKGPPTQLLAHRRSLCTPTPVPATRPGVPHDRDALCQETGDRRQETAHRPPSTVHRPPDYPLTAPPASPETTQLLRDDVDQERRQRGDQRHPPSARPTGRHRR